MSAVRGGRGGVADDSKTKYHRAVLVKPKTTAWAMLRPSYFCGCDDTYAPGLASGALGGATGGRAHRNRDARILPARTAIALSKSVVL